MRVNEKLWNNDQGAPLPRQSIVAVKPSEVTMWMQALMFTPYIAIASSLALGVTVAAVCCSQSNPRGLGFTAQ